MKHSDAEKIMEATPLLEGGYKKQNLKVPRWKSRGVVKTLVWICLILSCMDKFMFGLNYALNIYINDIKSTFNYTQTEVEVIIAVNNFGNGMMIAAALFNDRFGTKITLITSLVLSTGSYLLLWNSAANVNFYKDKMPLIASYFFLHGFGSNFGYIATLVITIRNFKQKLVGKIIGIQDAMIGAGPIIMTQVYYGLFKLSVTDQESQQYNFSSFMLFIALLTAVIDMLCLLFVNAYESDYNDGSTLNDQEGFTNTNGKSNTNSQINESSISIRTKWIESSNVSNLSLYELLHNPLYHLFMWTFVLMCCSDFITIDNLTTATRSLGYSSHDVITVTVWAACSFVSSLLTGVLVDYLKSKQDVLHLIAPVIGGVGLVLYITTAGYYSMFIVATIFTGICSGMIWVSFPAKISGLFGNEQFGRNWGLIVTVQTLCTFPVEYLFGYLYDRNIPDSSIYCYGVDCIRTGYQLLLITEVLAISVLIIRYTKRLKVQCKIKISEHTDSAGGGRL